MVSGNEDHCQERGTSFLTIRPSSIVAWLCLGELRNSSEKICWSKPGNPRPRKLGYRRLSPPSGGGGLRWTSRAWLCLNFQDFKSQRSKHKKEPFKLESCPKGDVSPRRMDLPCANSAQPPCAEGTISEASANPGRKLDLNKCFCILHFLSQRILQEKSEHSFQSSIFNFYDCCTIGEFYPKYMWFGWQMCDLIDYAPSVCLLTNF